MKKLGMTQKTILILSLIGIMFLLSCDPKDDPVECFPDSVNNVDGIIYNGHITLCNAQGSNLIYETGVCSLEVKTDLLIFSVFSTNPDFYYFYTDTLAYKCAVYEHTDRVFNLYDIQDSTAMGSVHETDNDIHLIIIDTECPNSSFFEGNQ